MEYTPNFNLAKPGTDDDVDVSVLNGNSDIIDTAVANCKANYSTTEREVGTWVDGSKLYEITVSTAITKNGSVPTDVSDLGIDKVIDIKSLALNTTISGSVVSVMTDSNGITTYYLQGSLYTQTLLQEVFYPLTAYITIRYTKVSE
jgi:hypothetical protein